MLFLLLAAAEPVLPGTYRCTSGGAAMGDLTLAADHGYRWSRHPAAGTWRYDRREGVFLIATGALALHDPRDGRYLAGRIEMTVDDGARWSCRMVPVQGSH